MSLNELHEALRELIARRHPGLRIAAPHHGDFRAGDVRHSEADIGKAKTLLGYRPAWDVRRGLAAALPWYEQHALASTPVVQGDAHAVRAV